MGRLFLYAIGVYLMVIACYLLWEQIRKRKKDAAKKRAFNPFKPLPKEDIMGKSQFDPCLLRPHAATPITSENRTEKDFILAGGISESTPVAIPASQLDRVFTPNWEDDNFIEYQTDTTNPELEPDDNESEDNDEEQEEEGDYVVGAVGVSLATALGFNDLAGMIHTVHEPEVATIKEKKEAGRVLMDIRKTDMFEQVVSGKEKERVNVGRLMDDYIADFNKHKHHQESEPEDTVVIVPREFDIRDYA